MSKLTGAALDRAVANAMGLKSVNNCEKWGKEMIEEDDDIQDYKRPWVGLTDEERNALLHLTITHSAIDYAKAIEQALKERNA
jgi:hypothetical protein